MLSQKPLKGLVMQVDPPVQASDYDLHLPARGASFDPLELRDHDLLCEGSSDWHSSQTADESSCARASAHEFP